MIYVQLNNFSLGVKTTIIRSTTLQIQDLECTGPNLKMFYILVKIVLKIMQIYMSEFIFTAHGLVDLCYLVDCCVKLAPKRFGYYRFHCTKYRELWCLPPLSTNISVISWQSTKYLQHLNEFFHSKFFPQMKGHRTII